MAGTLNSCILCKAAQASRNDLPYAKKKIIKGKKNDDFNNKLLIIKYALPFCNKCTYKFVSIFSIYILLIKV